MAVVNAAEQGQGLALVRWSLAADALAQQRVVLAHPQALRYARSYYFVCPESYLSLPNVAAFREWLIGVVATSPKPVE
jgi:LysR family glycine cleavage system transcriptional activator